MQEDSARKKKAWLRRYQNNRQRVIHLKQKYEQLENRILSAKTTNYTSVPGGGMSITYTDLIEDRLELEERIKKLELKGKGYRLEIIKIIDDVGDMRYTDILEALFIQGHSVEYIAEEEGYTTRHIYRLYSEAIAVINIPGVI